MRFQAITDNGSVYEKEMPPQWIYHSHATSFQEKAEITEKLVAAFTRLFRSEVLSLVPTAETVDIYVIFESKANRGTAISDQEMNKFNRLVDENEIRDQHRNVGFVDVVSPSVFDNVKIMKAEYETRGRVTKVG